MNKEKETIHFEDVYVLYYSKLKRFAKEYVLVEEDAENIVQDIFTDLWEHWDTFSTHHNLLAFLFLSIKNKCIDLLRRKAVTQKAESHIMKEYKLTLHANYYSLEVFDLDFSDRKDIEKRIRQALDALPEKCRHIFVKNKLEGKKQREISEELNISIKTVEAQIAIAYKKLRHELKDLLPLLAFLFY